MKLSDIKIPRTLSKKRKEIAKLTLKSEFLEYKKKDSSVRQFIIDMLPAFRKSKLKKLKEIIKNNEKLGEKDVRKRIEKFFEKTMKNWSENNI